MIKAFEISKIELETQSQNKYSTLNYYGIKFDQVVSIKYDPDKQRYIVYYNEEPTMIKLRTQHGIYEFWFKDNTSNLRLIHQFLPADKFYLKVTIDGRTYKLRVNDELHLQYSTPKTEEDALNALYQNGFTRIEP